MIQAIIDFQVVITLSVIVLVGTPYWICARLKKGKCKFEDLVVFVLNVFGAVTGVFILLGAFKVVNTQDAIWGGITGFCLTLFMVEKIMDAFRELFSPEVHPQGTTDQS